MELIDSSIAKKIDIKIIQPGHAGDTDLCIPAVSEILLGLYAAIPGNKRISYGRYYTVKILGQYIFDKFPDRTSLTELGKALYKDHHYLNRGVGLCILGHLGSGEPGTVLAIFEEAAADEQWEVREFAASFLQLITRSNRRPIRRFLFKLARCNDPFKRRMVSESLRPVSWNQWIQKEPDYSLSILKHMFKEPKAYPRSSVGNNLSDLARRNPEKIYRLVKKLVGSGDKNSFWIATRACRNLVKKEPIRVMDMLGIDEYKYKKRRHSRHDYQ